jgi:hypothetical protein
MSKKNILLRGVTAVSAAAFIVLGWTGATSAQSAELFNSYSDEDVEETEETTALEPDAPESDAPEVPAQSGPEPSAPMTEAQQPPAEPATVGASPESVLSSVVATAEAVIDVVEKAKAAAAALKAAQAESIAAADAVKAATQQKNFGAIKEAKKRVESATEAVKNAQKAAEEAAEALRAAGMEAEALALGIGAATVTDGPGLAAQGDAKIRKINTYVTLKYQIPEQNRTEKWGDVILETGYFGESGAFFGFEIGFASYMGSLMRLSDSSGSQMAFSVAFNCGSVKSLVSDLKLVYGMSAGFYMFGEFYKDTTTNYSNDTYDYSRIKELSWGTFGSFIGLRWRYIEFLYKGWVCMGYKEEEGSGKNIEAVPTISYSNQIQLGFRLAIKQEIKKDATGRVVTIRYGD